MGKASTRKFREDVAKTAKEMFDARLVSSTWGNVSTRILGTSLVAITPSGLSKGLLKAEDMVVVDMNGKVVEGRLKPSSDTPMHTMIYRSRPDVKGIVHTHSPFATSFAIAGKEIPCVTAELAATVGGRVLIARTTFEKDRPERTVVEALGEEKNAVLLQNHGVIAVGPTLEDALKVALMVEDAARVVVFATLIGQPIEIPLEEAAKLRKLYLEEYGQKNVGGEEASRSNV